MIQFLNLSDEMVQLNQLGKKQWFFVFFSDRKKIGPAKKADGSRWVSTDPTLGNHPTSWIFPVGYSNFRCIHHPATMKLGGFLSSTLFSRGGGGKGCPMLFIVGSLVHCKSNGPKWTGPPTSRLNVKYFRFTSKYHYRWLATEVSRSQRCWPLWLFFADLLVN